MGQDARNAENREEDSLDELLLILLAGGTERKAEVFRERRRRVSLGLELSPAGETSDPPVRRDDEGTALRSCDSRGLRSGHVSGAGAAALHDLAVDLAVDGGRALEWTEPPRLPADLGSEGRLARRLQDASAFLRHAAESEPRLRRARLQVQRDERSVHVASSEWGQASDDRQWWRLELELELETESGARAQAQRACGWPGGAPGQGFGALVDGLFERANEQFDALPAKPASPAIVLAAGGGAVLFHEAVGHALEGDVAARAGTVLSGKHGRRVALAGVSVFDDPTLIGRAGSARVDDEGAPGRVVALIEDGRVGEPLRDGLRCGFDSERTTGHGRRASHRVPPLPRMSNTYLAPGEAAFEDLVAPVTEGLLVERLERGAFDPATGAFRLRVAEARLIEGGRPGRPLLPFWLEGDTLGLLAGVEELGSELAWDDGCGTCGRDGQWLPVSAGCPAVRIAEGTLRVV